MQSKDKRETVSFSRGCIPFLSVLCCLCFRFTHFRWQILAVLLCFAVSYMLFRSKRRLIKSDSAALVVFLLLLFLVCSLGAIGYGITHTLYQKHDLDRNVFREKRILVMVPHQDDEINLFGGLYEIFEDSSDVFVMFSTNGDKRASAETRIREAVNALAEMGIDRNHIYFLGYGDSCESNDGVHMYNMPGNEVLVSSAERTETYATYGFEPYRHSSYTRNNMKEDIKALMLDLKPDVIFCIDYDTHHDHRALSLLFEESMGEILHRQNNTYTPAVFKGFAYSTAFLGERDFYAENIRSTVPYSEIYPAPGNFYSDGNGNQFFYMGENHIYLWNNRLRFPVAENNLSRTLRSSTLYKAMQAHQSQELLYSAMSTLPAVINGDKVFWPRNTSGLLYHADVTVSSGNGRILTDFKLIDSTDIYDKTHKPFDNLWTPDPEDDQKTATFTFREETAIDSICLYDNPSLSDNIFSIKILFSDGSETEYGPLAINGSVTTLRFDEKKITSFSVIILDSEGNQAGLSEVEAYLHDDPRDTIPEIIKLKNENGDFVYDYWMSDAPEEFSVYNALDSFEADASKNYSLKVLSGNCEIIKNRNDSFTVSCGKGASAELALYIDGKESPVDLVTVRNPFLLEKWWTSLLIEAEKNGIIYSPVEQAFYFRQLITDYWEKLPFVNIVSKF